MLLKILSFSLTLCHNTTQPDSGRVIYITADSDTSKEDCPAEQCHSLMNVLKNQSYYFDSNTTLEILPGTYYITEKIGQLVITEVNNFKIQGSSLINGRPNATIMCQPSATLGFTFVKSFGVEISNIQIRHCSAIIHSELNSSMLKNFTSRCNSVDSGNYHTFCYSFLASYRTELAIYQTAILHTNGIGILGLGNRYLDISESTLAHNEVNCINFVKGDDNTSFTVSDSQIMFGGIRHDLNFSSGMTLFIDLDRGSHDVILTNLKFENNKAQCGNLYIDANIVTPRDFLVTVHVNISISDITSIQTPTDTSQDRHGIVVKFNINLGYIEKRSSLDWFPEYPLYTGLFSGHSLWPTSLTSSSCCSCCHGSLYRNNILGSNNLLFDADDVNQRPRQVSIVLQNIYITGGCIHIPTSKVSNEREMFLFVMSNIVVTESNCITAMTVDNCDYKYANSMIKITLSDLTITSSYHNIISVDDDCTLELKGSTSLTSNRGSVLISGGKTIIKDFANISGNVAQRYESIFHISESSEVSFQGEIYFINNTGRQGGAISVSGAKIAFKNRTIFVGNRANINGGAISSKEGSVITLERDAHIIFKANVAREYGGAIYVEDDGLRHGKNIKCFIVTSTHHDSYKVEFENNSVGKAGPALFGGMIDWCTTDKGVKPQEFLVFNSGRSSSVSSQPYAVHMCTNSTINTTKTECNFKVFPGQTLEIEVATVGQMYGVAPASIRAKTNFGVIEPLQKIQNTENKCTKVKYTIKSSDSNVTIVLSVEQRNIRRLQNDLKVNIVLLDCPLGFEFNHNQNICVCYHLLLQYGVKCNLTTFTVNRNAHQWIGASTMTQNIVIHQHCPYDYCNSFALSLDLSSPDDQCNYKRSGTLCGACQQGLSQVLGTSRCKKCSNLWLLLIVVFALAGALLVASLMLLNLTVTTGTINGLIFYANIVRANNAVFFRDKASNSFLSWFIAWLNLDLGIETCFYDGLDAYVKTWLQFAFPIYIWLLVALIIVSSKYSEKVANLFSKNAVQVLATLFILSYAKLLRVTITIFQPTQLVDGYYMWHYDGNIDYFGKEHAPLTIVGLIFFILFFIPYTVILFGIQWLQYFSQYKAFNWVNRLKPLFDAYTGPYKDSHRYWTGLLLLVRIGLFIVFSANVSGDPSTNLLAIIITISCLLAYLALFAGVYKTRLLNVLEYSFLLNLIIQSAAVLYTTLTNGTVNIITNASVGIALSISAITVAYKCFMMIIKVLKVDKKIGAIHFLRKEEATALENVANLGQNAALLDHQVTHSIVELKEPLLEY